MEDVAAVGFVSDLQEELDADGHDGEKKGIAGGVEKARIAEQGAVTVTCEFCQRPYKFDAIDGEALFADSSPQGSSSIN